VNERKGKGEAEEEGKGRRRSGGSLAALAEFILVCSAPPLFLFYLMGWRPLTGKKEDKP